MPSKLFQARYAVFVHACPHGEDLVEVTVLKGWFSRRELRTESRQVIRTCVSPSKDVEEGERVAYALEQAAAALRGLSARD